MYYEFWHTTFNHKWYILCHGHYLLIHHWHVQILFVLWFLIFINRLISPVAFIAIATFAVYLRLFFVPDAFNYILSMNNYTLASDVQFLGDASLVFSLLSYDASQHKSKKKRWEKNQTQETAEAELWRLNAWRFWCGDKL